MIILKNGHLVSPTDGIDAKMDILIEGALIVKVAKNIEEESALVYDLKGKLIFPGFVDMHVHLREPGFEEKETIKSGSRAAVAGGFTRIAAMPNTSPIADDASVIKHIREVGERVGLAEIMPLGAVTQGQKGELITQMGDMIKSGALTFSDDGQPISDSYVMRRALEYASQFNKRIIVHSEDKNLTRDSVMNEGFISTKIGLAGNPNAAEETMIARDVVLAKYFGKVHFAHVSTSFAMDLIRMGKTQGVDITCEATPHHLCYTEEMLLDYDTNAKVSPPLRSKEDVQALIAGINDGTVDIIATDHAPHTSDDKDVEINFAANGISGLETAVPLIYTKLVLTKKISLAKMVELMAINPINIFGLDGGKVSAGEPAHFTIIDPENEKRVVKNNFKSKGKNTPINDWKLKGWPFMTIVRGEIVYNDGEVVKKGW